MQIGMAVLALVGSVGQVQIGVAVTAGDRGVAAAQGETCRRMIKFDLVLDDIPAGGGMARDARQAEGAMRILGGRNGARRLRSGSSQRRRNDGKKNQSAV